MSRVTRIDAAYGDHVRVAAERFGDHEDMSPGHVLRWLSQFDDEHIPLALRLLERIRYYNTLNIRTLCKHLVGMVGAELPGTQYPSMAIVPVGGPGSGAMVVARIIREVVDGNRCRLVDMLKLAQASPGQYSALVFVDDFSGTGDTLQKWWKMVDPIVRPLDAEVFLGILVLNYRAREKVESIASRVLCVDELDQAADVFDGACPHFSEQERLLLLKYAKKTGCKPKHERGYGHCGLILSFKHGCPNNSIPTLWHGSDVWKALFLRRGV